MGQTAFFGQLPKGVFQGFRYRLGIFVPHFPQRDGTVVAAVGVAYVKHMAEP
ncbi:hypothetical protein L9W92_10080 [Pelotomaculum terephthalicicum JT]|uniref:hypothetical protein n=1 Tax=Pelotomaculum terephthalicicum TaxID=206393 RepID=UPI001F04E4FF|nr:hypothetical protein [Pelotomaculum terephthalicicum]MCG9968400.1 hypothetical protein [Pelotomaculum terephthalicicum JT]